MPKIIFSYDDIKNVVCDTVEEKDLPDIREVANDMLQYCIESAGGVVGVAGPQVGLNKKVMVFKRRDGSYTVAYNPIYYKVGKSIKVIEECLSCVGRYIVDRNKEVQAIYYIEDNGKLKKVTKALRGEEAIYFAHETDHVGNGNEKPITIQDKGVEF